MKPATSNLASHWRLPRPIIKSHAEEKWAWPWTRVAPQNFGVFLQYISATAEASEFKFGMPLGLTKGHHKITPRGESGRGPGLGKLRKILKSPFNTSATSELATANLVCSLGLPRPIIKLHTEEKWARGG